MPAKSGSNGRFGADDGKPFYNFLDSCVVNLRLFSVLPLSWSDGPTDPIEPAIGLA